MSQVREEGRLSREERFEVSRLRGHILLFFLKKRLVERL